jgi:hypothetical protein
MWYGWGYEKCMCNFSKNLDGRDHLGDLYEDGSIILLHVIVASALSGNNEILSNATITDSLSFHCHAAM